MVLLLLAHCDQGKTHYFQGNNPGNLEHIIILEWCLVGYLSLVTVEDTFSMKSNIKKQIAELHD